MKKLLLLSSIAFIACEKPDFEYSCTGYEDSTYSKVTRAWIQDEKNTTGFEIMNDDTIWCRCQPIQVR